MIKNKYFEIGMLCLIIGSCLGVILLSFTFEQKYNYLYGAGEIEFYTIEDGIYAIISNDGAQYEPINLPDKFKVDGLQVEFILKLPNDMTSYHLWLRIVEIHWIKETSK